MCQAALKNSSLSCRNFASSSNNLWQTIMPPLHGGGQGFESPRLHFINLLTRSTGKIDDNFDDNRADMERYIAAHTYRFELTKHLQIRRFAALNNTRATC